MKLPSNSRSSVLPIAVFILLAFGITWTIQIGVSLELKGLSIFHIPAALHNLSLFGPAIAALATTAIFEGKKGTQALLSRNDAVEKSAPFGN